MFNFDYIAKGNMKKQNSTWPEFPDYPYRIFLFEGSGSGEINQILTKFCYMLKIHMKPNINC